MPKLMAATWRSSGVPIILALSWSSPPGEAAIWASPNTKWRGRWLTIIIMVVPHFKGFHCKLKAPISRSSKATGHMWRNVMERQLSFLMVPYTNGPSTKGGTRQRRLWKCQGRTVDFYTQMSLIIKKDDFLSNNEIKQRFINLLAIPLKLLVVKSITQKMMLIYLLYRPQ